MDTTWLITNLKSWKTTALGILGGLAIIIPELQALLDSDPATVFSKAALMAGLGMLGVGINAKDGNKTSKELGLDQGDQK